MEVDPFYFSQPVTEQPRRGEVLPLPISPKPQLESPSPVASIPAQTPVQVVKRTPEHKKNTPSPKKRVRGGYKCGYCNVPKKGHVCPYLPRLKRDPNVTIETKDVSCQAEMDTHLCLRELDCGHINHRMGCDETYAQHAEQKQDEVTLVQKPTSPPFTELEETGWGAWG